MTPVTKDGEAVGRVGVIKWNGASELRLRSSQDTAENNIIRTLPFNTRVQVIKRFAGDWLLVSTPNGEIGYVASHYVSLSLPEPGARLHIVQPGTSGTAIAIAETYYGNSISWGQDLRFYVNVLAHANRVSVPQHTSGWKEVHFRKNTLIWIPSRRYAQSLVGAISSGSISYNFANLLGSCISRMEEIWNDFNRAFILSKQYLGGAIGRHAKKTVVNVLTALAEGVVVGVAIMALSTSVGAAIGALAGGVGAVPGAAAGFEFGLVILEWLGLAMLLSWVMESLWKVGKEFAGFIATVWNARGSAAAIDRGARQFAESLALLLAAILEGLAMLVASRGVTWTVNALRGTTLGRNLGERGLGQWLNERVDAFHDKVPGRPRGVLGRWFRGVEIVERTSRGKENPLGEFDGIDMEGQTFIEYKAARKLNRKIPGTDRVQQTPAEWAKRDIFSKTVRRIEVLLNEATATRPTSSGSPTVPTLAEIKGFRRFQFRIDGDSPALRSGVAQALASLRSKYPGWSFEVRWGVNILLPPLPDWATPAKEHEN